MQSAGDGNTNGSAKRYKMSHRDVNMRRIQSCSGRVRCSPEARWEGAAASCSASPPPGAPLAPARSRRDAPVLCGRCDRENVPSFLAPCARCPHSDRLENVTAKNERWCFQSPEERRRGRRRRRKSGDGDGGGVRGGFGGSKRDGVSWPPPHSLYLPPSVPPSLLLLFLLASPLITDTKRQKKHPPPTRLSSDLTPHSAPFSPSSCSSDHHPGILYESMMESNSCAYHNSEINILLFYLRLSSLGRHICQQWRNYDVILIVSLGQSCIDPRVINCKNTITSSNMMHIWCNWNNNKYNKDLSSHVPSTFIIPLPI